MGDVKRLTDEQVYDRLHDALLMLGAIPAQTDLGYEVLKRALYFIEALQKAMLEQMEASDTSPSQEPRS